VFRKVFERGKPDFEEELKYINIIFKIFANMFEEKYFRRLKEDGFEYLFRLYYNFSMLIKKVINGNLFPL